VGRPSEEVRRNVGSGARRVGNAKLGHSIFLLPLAACEKASGRHTYLERNPAMVEAAKALRKRGMSLRAISAELAKQDFLSATGTPCEATAIKRMVAA